MKNKSPKARLENIVVQESKDELLICDTKNSRVLCLNKTAGEVWKLSDGNNDTRQIANLLSQKFGTNVNEEVVLFALDELRKENLLVQNVSGEKAFFGVSRREVIRKIGLTSAVALPVISAIVMPKAINAQSNTCADNGDCDFPLYCDLNTSTCQPRPENCTQATGQPNSCPSNLECCNEGDTCSYGC